LVSVKLEVLINFIANMDDSWGNIIYLIAMAIFVIFGALKKKKPATVVHPPDESEMQSGADPKSSLDSIFETLLGHEVPEPYVQPVEEVLPEKEESMMEEYTRLKKGKTEERREGQKDPLLSNLKTSHIKTEQKMDLDDEIEEIDWRQAIIYREILDRKYN
jgi:hypothetical protein